MPPATEREPGTGVAAVAASASYRDGHGRALLPGRSSGSRTLECCAPAPAYSRLIRLHRHSLFHLLLVGGTNAERERLAFAFHRGSPIRRGPFVRLDAARDEDRLRCALEHALSAVTCERLDNPLRESDGGTLFLDRVSHLSLATQHVLLRVLASLRATETGPCFSRLAVGSEGRPEDAAAAGRLHPALFDILDKIRVELGSGTRGGAR